LSDEVIEDLRLSDDRQQEKERRRKLEEERKRRRAERLRQQVEAEEKMRRDDERKKREEQTVNIPPQPLLKSGPPRGINPIWYVLGIFACLACFGVIWLGGNRILAPSVSTPTQKTIAATSTLRIWGSTSTPFVWVPTDIRTYTNLHRKFLHSCTLPIREDFSKQYSDLWWVSEIRLVQRVNADEYNGVCHKYDRNGIYVNRQYCLDRLCSVLELHYI
jgi:hypothetical protein